MKQLIISKLIDIYFVQDNELRHLVQKNTQCGYTDWVNVSTEIGHGMTNTQCQKRWVIMNKGHWKPRCQATSTAVSAYLPVDPELLVLVTDRTSASMAFGEDTGIDRYDADVESAFNKQGRKRKPDDRRTMWTSDMVSDSN
jgi:hypothetical protein